MKNPAYDPKSVLVNLLKSNLAADPEDWKSRKEYARFLYDENKAVEAAEVIWEAPYIPSVDLELGFALKILSKGSPRRAIRLLAHLQEVNEGKPVQNMGIANALLHHGLVMQAARFYGAAIQLDPTLANPNLEHFLLWVDDSEKMWGDFKDQPKIFEELPWIKREDKEEAARFVAFKSGHTTPVKIPGLARSPAELGSNPLYTQDPRLDSPVGPPPSVTIPMDRVEDKYRVYNNNTGAETSPYAEPTTEMPAGNTVDAPLPGAQVVVPPTAMQPTEYQEQQVPSSGPRTVFVTNKNFVTSGNKIVRSRPAIDPREGNPMRIKPSE